MAYGVARYGGGGANSLNCTAEAGDVVSGYTAVLKDGDTPQAGTLVLDGDASTSDVLEDTTFYNVNPKDKKTGTMPNNGAVSKTLNAGGTYTIPKGYHNGLGKVTANSLASQTQATANAPKIRSGYTAMINGVLVRGTATFTIN